MSDEQKSNFFESVLKYWPIIALAITLAGGAFTSFGAAAVIFYKFSQSEGEKKEMKAESVKQYGEILGKLESIKDSVNSGKSDINSMKTDITYFRERLNKVESNLEKLNSPK